MREEQIEKLKELSEELCISNDTFLEVIHLVNGAPQLFMREIPCEDLERLAEEMLLIVDEYNVEDMGKKSDKEAFLLALARCDIIELSNYKVKKL